MKFSRFIVVFITHIEIFYQFVNYCIYFTFHVYVFTYDLVKCVSIGLTIT